MTNQLRGGVKGGYSAVAAAHPPSQPLPAQLDSIEPPHGHEHWPKGLTNVGNSCYANAALQCLLSTALTNALLDPRIVPLLRRYSSNPNLLAMGSGSVDSEDSNNLPKTPRCEDEERRKEREKQRMQENCEWLTNELTMLTQQYIKDPPAQRSNVESSSYMGWLSQTAGHGPLNVVNPGNITKHPHRLSKCLRPYQQEDAHEFLRALLGTLVMNGRNRQLSSLFDGLLESAVTCKTCGRASLTRDRYMDLSLDINQPDITTLEDALFEFTKTEVLSGDNAVFCNKCEAKQTVTKGLRLATAPSILVCHLKRFAFDSYGRLVRLHKKIDFPLRLHITDYMSKMNKARPPPYDLVGILVHQGQTCASGHYLAFVKKNGEWFKCNDSVITKVDEETVLNQQAYIMMYEVAEMRKETCTPRSSKPKPTTNRSNSLPVFDDEEPEFMKDDFTQSSSMKSSAGASRFSASAKAPPSGSLGSLLQFFSDAEGFISELCCDSSKTGLNEPRTTEVKHKRRKNRDDPPCDSSGSSELRRTFSSEGVQAVQVIDVQWQSDGSRAQTAPRQRTQSEDCTIEQSFNISSPHTTISAKQTTPTFGRYQTMGSRSREKRRGARSSTINSLVESGDLPPLPHQPGRRRRAKSNGTPRKKGGYIV